VGERRTLLPSDLDAVVSVVETSKFTARGEP
jgi:hypothetical protein